ncbi:F0F1 ATP synthase subunit delta [Actinopolymorpha singaporensis]|uniref:ATP synthase subunit delta n=1 Tax=Actinopolymorpha singaporensis TaxID=117157 RepID=A0A1H1YJ55_9ACTN|nr:F0F1 ATP synthase subunit delta [Actinopolymorpha singaporensis]SDT21487.1 F-type H+-transporting ATPase subunit delta [Actinopolymorpha singaporensis]
MTDFHGTSREAVASLRQRLRGVAGTPAELQEAGRQLFSVVRLLDAQPALRRALTDSTRTPDDRAALAGNLLGSRIGAQALDLVTAAVRLSWPRTRQFTDALEEVGALALVRSAEEEGRLDDLEDALFRFARLLEREEGLHLALTDRGIPADNRATLVRELLAGKAPEGAVPLVEQAVVAPRGLSLTEALDNYAKLAAGWRERLVATVRTATPLSAADQDRLAGALRRQYGHDVHLNILVDPGVLGGMRVELGAEVIDGTIASRLDDARRRLAG